MFTFLLRFLLEERVIVNNAIEFNLFKKTVRPFCNVGEI